MTAPRRLAAPPTQPSDRVEAAAAEVVDAQEAVRALRDARAPGHALSTAEYRLHGARRVHTAAAAAAGRAS